MSWVEGVFYIVYGLILTYIFIGVRQDRKRWRSTEEKLAQLKKLTQLEDEVDRNLSVVKELMSAVRELRE